MKKYLLIAAVVALSVFNLAGVFTQATSANDGGGQKCDTLIGCGSTAGCSGKGTPSGCTITCEDRTIVICPAG